MSGSHELSRRDFIKVTTGIVGGLIGAMSVSGAVLAGVLGWLLVRALARAGALSAFPPGQEHRESHAV